MASLEVHQVPKRRVAHVQLRRPARWLRAPKVYSLPSYAGARRVHVPAPMSRVMYLYRLRELVYWTTAYGIPDFDVDAFDRPRFVVRRSLPR